jgi:membrane fusion protein, multidrug efflux system
LVTLPAERIAHIPMVKKLAAVLCIAVLTVGAVMRSEDDKAKAAMPLVAPPPVPVAVTEVQQSDVPINLSGLGQVQAFNEAMIRPQVSGQITSIDYSEGQLVQKGALLAQISPRPYQARLDQAKAMLAKDEAHVSNAEANLGRYASLARDGFASTQQMQTQQSMASQARADVAADKAVIEQDQISLDYTSITAPFTGVVGLSLVDVGNVVQAGQTQGLATITQIQPIAVLFTLPQADLPQIQTAINTMGGASQLAVTAWSEDGTKQLGTGRLLAIANTVNASSGTITLRAVFPNENRMLWPGEFVDARLRIQTVHNGLTIPESVVQLGPNGTYAWRVVDQRATMQPIDVTSLPDGRDLVTQGLTARETVVTDGQYGLSDGAAVDVESTNSPLRNAQTTMLGIQP